MLKPFHLAGYDDTFYYYYYFLTLQYCIGFTIYQHESATGIHVFPILNPPPSSRAVPFVTVSLTFQPQTLTCTTHSLSMYAKAQTPLLNPFVS